MKRKPAKPTMVHIFRRSFDVPELREVSPAVVAKLVKVFERDHAGPDRSRLAIVQAVQLAAIAALIMLTVLIVRFIDGTLVKLIILLIMWAVVVLIVGEMGSRAMNRVKEDFIAFLREYCPDGKPRFCLKCDYDLRGSDSGTCPECGAAVSRVMV